MVEFGKMNGQATWFCAGKGGEGLKKCAATVGRKRSIAPAKINDAIFVFGQRINFIVQESVCFGEYINVMPTLFSAYSSVPF